MKHKPRVVVAMVSAAALSAFVAVVVGTPAALGHDDPADPKHEHVGGGPSQNLEPAPFEAELGPFVLNPIPVLTVKADLNADGDTEDQGETSKVEVPGVATGGKLILTVFKAGGTEPGATTTSCDNKGTRTPTETGRSSR